MTLLHRMGSLVLLALVAGCGGQTAQTVPTPVAPVLAGTVRDYQTQAPMAHATVLFAVGALDSTGAPNTNGYHATTDDSGHYSIPQPPPLPSGAYAIMVNSIFTGGGSLAGPNYRGDLLVDAGDCVARFGQVFDAVTLKPIAGATLNASPPATTDATGWYRVDWGCPAGGTFGAPIFGTAALSASAPGYATLQSILGRGIADVKRLDFLLKPLQ